MTTISIMPDTLADTGSVYRAVSGGRQSVGRTAGEALDLLTAQLNDEDSGTLVVVQHMRGDALFNDAQRSRLAQLMLQWRESREQGTTLSGLEQAELQGLVDAEFKAALDRTKRLVDRVQP